MKLPVKEYKANLNCLLLLKAQYSLLYVGFIKNLKTCVALTHDSKAVLWRVVRSAITSQI